MCYSVLSATCPLTAAGPHVFQSRRFELKRDTRKARQDLPRAFTLMPARARCIVAQGILDAHRHLCFAEWNYQED